jgi:tetratricopeptide (TPR) repeat protein
MSAPPRTSSGLGSHPRRWYAAALLLAGLAAYSSSLAGQFVFDDRTAIWENPSIRSLADADRLSSPRGLVDLSFAVNYALGGVNPLGYHLVNLAIHLCTGLVLFGLVRRTLSGTKLGPRFAAAADPLAFAVALLWLVHPLTTQAVTYICQRYESAAALFYLLGLYAFCRGCAPGARQKWWFVLVMLCCALSMRSKETGVTFPLVLLWYDRALLAGRWREVWSHKTLYGALVLTIMVLVGPGLAPLLRGPLPATVAERDSADAGAPLRHDVLTVEGVTPWTYLATQPAVILHYLRLCLWPVGQCFDYDWPVAQSAAAIVPPLLVVLALGLAVVWAVPRYPGVAWLGGAFFLFLAPTSSVLPLRDLAVEHRMYLPLAAVLTLVVLGAHAIFSRRATGAAPANRRSLLGGAVLAVIALTLGVLTWTRNTIYASEQALWEDTCAAAPNNPRAHTMLAGIYLVQHQTELAHKHLAIAAAQLERKLAENPDAIGPCVALALVLPDLGRGNEVPALYERALALDPASTLLRRNYGKFLTLEHKLKEAAEQYEAALASEPRDAPMQLALADVRFQLEELEPAERHYREALRLDPDAHAAHLKLAVLLNQSERAAEALEHLERAVELSPSDAWTHVVLAQVCRNLHQTERALRELRAAEHLGGHDPLVLAAVRQERQRLGAP